MNGARFVHDRLELAGWQVEIADAQKVKGLAPLACKTDRIDAWVLAELARRDLVPAIWLPDPSVRAERERARWRLHLVRHRSQPEAARARGAAHARQALPRLRPVRRPRPPAARRGSALPEPWQGTIEASLRLIDELDARDQRLRARAAPARRRPPLRAAALHRARDRLGARLHDRRRDRRHQPLPHAAQARRLHRPLPARLPIRRTRPARPARQTGPPLPALGARRSRHPRLHRTRLPRPLPANESAGSANNAAPRSPRSTSPADSPRRSGTCSPATQPFAPKGATDPLAA